VIYYLEMNSKVSTTSLGGCI